MLVLVSSVYYFYLTFKGYGILPFIKSPSKFLLPIPVIAVCLMVMSLVKLSSWNILLTLLTI